ncbi:myb-binding protein 1A-like protein [Mangifera indica]|uniref:myb-binding protein 1A-like protein n=1 Tax=Mangifera indica TaxID=29780 RepID=UPI001CFB7AC7|nr:myb-binding protein 1A-like protein [Mangifera indica]
MGSKKRNSNAVEEAEAIVDSAENVESDNVVASSVKKKMKKGKKKDGDRATADASIKPMERKKKRKAMDKERHHTAMENIKSQPKQTDVVTKSEGTLASTVFSSSSGMPEFHISVFQDLASADVSMRQVAAESLVTELEEVQKAYERGGKESVKDGMKLEAEKDDGLNDCAPSLRYAVRRLIRGVSSSRECARQGFALGLTLLIGKIPSIKMDALLKLIVDLLEVSASMKGLEARDCLLGRLFAYGAIAQSGRLTNEWNSDKNTPYIKEFIGHLISLAAKRRYLQEPAVSIILDLIEKLPTEALLSHVLEAPGLHEWLEGASEVGNPDALLLALRIQEKVSVDSKKLGKLLPTPFSSSKLFAADHLSSLVNCLKESTFCQPRVHSVWPVLVNILLPDSVLQAEDAASVSSSLKKHKKSRKSSSSEEVAKNLQSFCEVIVEGSLLLSSHDRKHLAFDVLALIFLRLPASFVSIVLSYKLVHCLIDVLPSKDAWLYNVAKDFLKKIVEWVGNDDVRRVAVIVALQKHSNGKFDSITRTKTVKDLMAEFKTESGCTLFIQNLVNMFIDESSTSEEPSDQSQTTDDNSEIGSVGDKDLVGTLANSDFLKSWVIESLPSILKYLNLDPEAKFRVQKEVLKFLAVQGLFSASLGTEVTSFELQEKFRWPKAPTSSALCRMCIEQLQSLLANAQKVENLRSFPNGLEPSDLGSYFMRFLSTLRNIPSVSLFRSLSADDEKTLKKLQEMETRLSREERNCGLSMDANKLHALRYLLIQLLLQVLLRPGEYSEPASELIMCCKKAFASSDLLNSSTEDELDDDSAPKLMDVLVDTLLSLLPQSSAPMRSAIEQVFKYFCNDVTDDGLLRMLQVIKRDLKPSRHRNADTEEEDDDEDFLGIEEEEDEAEPGETGESDEQTDDSEAVAAVEGGDKELPVDSDNSDSGMDDEAMFRMDTYLAQIFKEKKNQAGSETAQSQLNLFKLRVLSLLEIYLHENPGRPQVLMVYSNLAQALVNPHTAEGSGQLEQRIWGILQKKIFKAKDFPKAESVPLPTLTSLLERNLKLAARPFKRKKSAANPSKKKQSASWNRYKMIVSLAQNSTFWILKIIDARKFSESELQEVYDIFQIVLASYFDSKKSQLKSEFLKEIFRRRPWIGHHLFSFVLEKCGSAKSGFRQVEALDLVMEILKSMVLLSSDEASRDASKKVLKSHLRNLSCLIKELVTHMPEKPSRKSEVRKFCSKIFQTVSSLKLTNSFLKDLTPDGHAACESELGEAFLSLKKVK